MLGSAGAEQEYKWEIEKEVNEFMHKVEISAHAWDMKDVVVDVDGGKQQFTNLRLEIVFEPSIKFDSPFRVTKWCIGYP